MPLPSLPTLPQNNGVQGPQSGATPAPIHVARYARNGLLPHAVYETELGNSLNFAARIRRKNLFTWFCPIDDIPGSLGAGSPSRSRWRAAARTGPLLSKLKAYVYMARQNTGAVESPKVTIYVTNADASTTYGTGVFEWGNSVVATTDTPDEFQYGEVTITGVSANTDVYFRLEDCPGPGRLIACTIFEEGLPIWDGNGYPRSQVAVTSPILDDRRSDMLQLASNLWKQGAAHLWNFSVDNQDDPIENASATSTNVLDGTSTAVSAASPGATLDLRYNRTRSVSTVPCTFKVFAKMSGAADTGEVTLVDSTGTPVATISINGGSTAQWYSATVDMPASLAKYDVMFSNPDFASGAETISVYAFSLYQYEA